MNNELLIKVAEGIIFTSQSPISIKDLEKRLPDCKDINALINKSKEVGVNMNVLEAAWKTNLEVRPEQDWSTLKGRAVSDK